MKTEGRPQSLRPRAAAAWALAWLMVAASAPAADLLLGSWRLSTPLGESSGTLLALIAGEGAWRCEVGAAAESTPDLLHRLGRGWTLTGDGQGGFVQAWHDPWRQVGPRAARTFRRLLTAWAGDEDCRPRFASQRMRRRWQTGTPGEPAGCVVVLEQWDDLPAGWRPEARTNAAAGALRRSLTARGSGRGGEGLSLHLRWVEEQLAVTSVRWPGTLTLERPQRQQLDVPDEAFLTLWPLAEFLP